MFEVGFRRKKNPKKRKKKKGTAMVSNTVPGHSFIERKQKKKRQDGVFTRYLVYSYSVCYFSINVLFSKQL